MNLAWDTARGASGAVRGSQGVTDTCNVYRYRWFTPSRTGCDLGKFDTWAWVRVKIAQSSVIGVPTCPGYSTVRDLAESGNSIPTTDALISLATRPSMPCISFAIASRTFWTTCGTL